MIVIWRKNEIFVSKDKCIAHINILYTSEILKDTEEDFMLPYNWLYLHSYQNEHSCNVACELETVFYCYANTSMQ